MLDAVALRGSGEALSREGAACMQRQVRTKTSLMLGACDGVCRGVCGAFEELKNRSRELENRYGNPKNCYGKAIAVAGTPWNRSGNPREV